MIPEESARSFFDRQASGFLERKASGFFERQTSGFFEREASGGSGTRGLERRVSPSFEQWFQRDVDLAKSSNYRTGGVARWFIQPTVEQDFVDAIEFARRENLPWFVIGGGTNTLIQDEVFEGVVISTKKYEARAVGGFGLIHALAGTTLRTLIGASITAGLEGLETFIGIPGTIGGAVWGNAGGPGGGIAPLVESMRVLEPDGTIRWIPGAKLPWAYRSSGLADRTVLEVRLRLAAGFRKDELRARALDLYDQKKRTQPLHARSAGCVFRNPPGDRAGRLIEAAGCKGKQLGGARVSDRHANFIVNEGGATAAEITRLIEEVRLSVANQFGIWLRREIIVAGVSSGGTASDPSSGPPRAAADEPQARDGADR